MWHCEYVPQISSLQYLSFFLQVSFLWCIVHPVEQVSYFLCISVMQLNLCRTALGPLQKPDILSRFVEI